MGGDWLDSWEEDWEARALDPDLTARAGELRRRGFGHTEVAAALGVSVAAAYRAAQEYEETPDPATTIAHLLTTVNFNLAHARRHTRAALASEGDERQFNLEHVDRHLEEAASHAGHLRAAIGQQYPRIGAEYERVMKEAGGE